MSLPMPYYPDGYVTIYHGDCLEILTHLPKVDAVVTDPPYGMNWDTNGNRFSGGETKDGFPRVKHRGVDWGDRVIGDDTPFDPSPWLEFEEVILFGSNHYAERLPVGTTLVWIKRNDPAFGTFLSDAEIAWQKGGHGVYCYRDVSSNGAGANFPKLHLTQKTPGVMKWCLSRLKCDTDAIILDPFMGSGTTLRAAKDLGRKAIGIEIEEKYCEIAAQRMMQEVLPL